MLEYQCDLSDLPEVGLPHSINNFHPGLIGRDSKFFRGLAKPKCLIYICCTISYDNPPIAKFNYPEKRPTFSFNCITVVLIY
jgi:hypothetical protein